MVTVPEAARRAGRDPETIRRWIRAGRLRSERVGTQHLIDERDLEAITASGTATMPRRWQRFESGRPMPDLVAALERSRRAR